MSVSRSVAEVLADHVTLEMEGIDRMYLNVYVPGLQREQGVACFFRFHRGNQFVSSALMDPISKAFIAGLEAFARKEKIPVITFHKGQRKDDVAAEQRKKFQKSEGVVFIGKAQEKTPVFRTERRRNEKTTQTSTFHRCSDFRFSHQWRFDGSRRRDRVPDGPGRQPILTFMDDFR